MTDLFSPKRLAFVYPVRHPVDALPNWVRTLSQHCERHEVLLAEGSADAEGMEPDGAILLTSCQYRPAFMLADIHRLTQERIPVGVLHNEDWGMVPPEACKHHFCWTHTAWRRLAGYKAHTLRQPVLPPYGPEPNPDWPLHLATFGNCEEKKDCLHMARWCKRHGIRFTMFAPEMNDPRLDIFPEVMRQAGAHVIRHGFQERVTNLAWDLDREKVTHLIFDQTRGKGGTGGSPTSCRYAAAFKRPVIVLDDELTFFLDGFQVIGSLDQLELDDFKDMGPPRHDWLPDDYVGEILKILTEGK